MANTVIVNVEANTASATANITSTTVAVDNLTKAEQKLNKESQKVASGFEDVTKNGGAIAILDQLTGGLASRVRDTAEATKLFNFSLRGMRTALIATGIGAFIVALGLIVAYWDDIVEFIGGANKELQKQIDLKKEYIGELEGEIETEKAKKALLLAQGRSVKSINKDIEKRLRNLTIEQKKLMDKAFDKVVNLRYKSGEDYFAAVKVFQEAELKHFKLQADDFNRAAKRAKERKEKKVQEQKDLEAAEVIRQKAIADALQDEREKADAIEQITAGQVNTEAEKRAEEIRLNKNKYEDLLTLAREYYAEDSTQIQELEQTQQELETEIKLRHAEEDAATEKIITDKIAADKKIVTDKAAADKAIADKEIIDAEEIVAETQIAIRDAELSNAAGGINLLASLLPKSRALQAAAIIGSNAAGIAKIIQQTTASNVAITAQGTALAIPSGGASVTAAAGLVAANKVSAGINIATSVLATAKGLAALKSGGGTNPSVTIPSDSGGGAQVPAFNIVGQGEGSQIASALGEQQQTPIQAFVVSQDVTTAQSLQNNIIQGATLGD